MSQDIFNVGLAFTLLFALASIVLAALFRASISDNDAAVAAFIKHGHPLGGAASSVKTLKAAYFWPWKSVPDHLRLTSGQYWLLRSASSFAFLAMLILVAGFLSALVADWL